MFRCFCLGISAFILTAQLARAERFVEFDSPLGTFYVRLFDGASEAPLTVENFLQYSADGDYDGSIIHRSDSSVRINPGGDFEHRPFVIQGGEAAFDDDDQLFRIPSNPAVTNEPGISNTRGTLALARVSGQINSGTNNWFINLNDNTFLDNVDQGFTVFGEVIGNGMDVVDAIAALPTFPLNDPGGNAIFPNVPFIGDLSAGVGRENFVVFSTIREVSLSPGDYNRDGLVDVADYNVWRDSFGSTSDLAADGSGNGVIDEADYGIFVANLGERAIPVAGANLSSSVVPEPSTLGLCLVATVLATRRLQATRLETAQKKAGLE